MSEGIESPIVLANLARGRLRDKIPHLEEALCGHMSVTQRWLLHEQLHKVGDLDKAIGRLDAKITELCLPFGALYKRLWP